jgi:deazaflavin-dependent oxidoreductase (nitroreductase family)
VARCIGPTSASRAPVQDSPNALNISPRIDPWLYRVTRGRYPTILGTVATAPLITTGAKSGLPREHQLTYFHDGPDPILLATYGGGPKHPQWYYNLTAHPECQFGDERFVATEVTDSDEYARLYGLAEQVYAGYRLSRQDGGSGTPYSPLPAQGAIAASRPGCPYGDSLGVGLSLDRGRFFG